MLSIGKLSPGQEMYYERSVAGGADDYYSGKGESPGRWAGRGAEHLGLAGEVAAGELSALTEGRNPATGGEVRAHRVGSVAAFDLTFSAPKSVSILHALADGEMASRLIDCHERSVAAALAYVEDTALYVRRGHGGAGFEKGETVFGAFRHRMSRAEDPQLHTHCVVPNMARGPDGRWTALHHPSLYRAAKTAGYLYQAELRARVREEFGWEWGPVRNGAAELAAVPAAVREEFSRRKQEIAELASEAGAVMGGPATLSTFVLSSRAAKDRTVETAPWRAEVGERAAAYGFACPSRGSAAAMRARPVVVDSEHLAGPEGLTMMRNTFDERDVLREIAQAAAHGARVEEIRALAADFLARGDVVSLDGERRTTQDLLDAERRRERMQLDRAATWTGLVGEKAIRDGTRGLSLNDGQRAVVEAVFRSGNGVDIIEAQAGTGKTYTAGAIRAVAEHAGRRVVGTAPTGRAARELESEAGIEACTLDSLVYRLTRGLMVLGPKDVIVADEMGMAGTRLAARLEAHADRMGAKVVEVRDRRQLPSVLAGGEVTGAHEALGGLELTEIVRQRSRKERRALGRLHAGDVEAYIGHLEQHGRVVYSARVADAVAAYSEDVAAVGFEGVALVVPTNAMAREANRLVREERYRNGELGREHVVGGLALAEGDRVLFRRNNWRMDVSNGDRGTVRWVHGSGVDVALDRGGSLRHVDRGYVEKGHLQHGYAGTVHKHQGQTVERAVVAGRAGEMYAELAYVAASRAREGTRMFIVGDDAREDARAEIAPASRSPQREQRQELLMAMGSSRVEELAIEQVRDRGASLDL